MALDPAREFDRVLQQQSTDIQAVLTVAKPSIRMLRDPLQMQLKAAQAGYFYVLIDDTDGQVRMLFPNDEDADNRIHRWKAGESAAPGD